MRKTDNGIHNIENSISRIASSLGINVNDFIEDGSFNVDRFLEHASKKTTENSKTA